MRPAPLPTSAASRQMHLMSKERLPMLRLRHDLPAIWLVVAGFALGSVVFHFGGLA